MKMRTELAVTGYCAMTGTAGFTGLKASPGGRQREDTWTTMT